MQTRSRTFNTETSVFMNNSTMFLLIYAENNTSVDYAQTWEENKNQVKWSKLCLGVPVLLQREGVCVTIESHGFPRNIVRLLFFH